MKKLGLLLMSICLCCSLMAQRTLPLSIAEQEIYKAKIKLVDEFIDRFNGDESNPNIDEDSEYSRAMNLLFLFDGTLFSSKEDSSFICATAMIDSIISHNVTINYEDTTWIAKAVCHAKLEGEDVKFILYLNVEHRSEDMYKWVITKAESEIFKLEPSVHVENVMMLPDVHETNFMSLHNITTTKDDNITCFMQKGFDIDETSVFLAYVYKGLLDIEYVSDLEFVFFQVPGYVFSIKRIYRETNNSGWLISSFQKKSEEEKKAFLKHLYNQ